MDEVKQIIDAVVVDPDQVMSLTEMGTEQCLPEVTSFFEKENALLELDGDVAFVGDLHGDFETTKAIVSRFADEVDHLVFLGDYIDRAPLRWGSVYTVTYLMLLKCHDPKKIILLKGNHECNYLIPCYPYEFQHEITQRFGTPRLHDAYIAVFSQMPLMVHAHQVFAAHAGILKGADLQQLKQLGKNDVAAVEALVWSDPEMSPTYRGAGDRFNGGDLAVFLDEISARVLLRGHDYNLLGFSIYDDRCLTLFSSRRYQGMGNQGILVARTKNTVHNIRDLHVEDYSSGKWKQYTVASV